MTQSTSTARAAWLLALLLGCAAPTPPGPPFAGIAELTLPAGAASLRDTAVAEDAAGSVTRRRALLAGVHRQLLMSPADDTTVPELFDVVVALAPRMEAGAISPAWASYLYTTYQRDLRTERPDGAPRRSPAEITVVIDEWVAYYRIQSNPRAPGGLSVRDAEFQALRAYRDDRRRAR